MRVVSVSLVGLGLGFVSDDRPIERMYVGECVCVSVECDIFLHTMLTLFKSKPFSIQNTTITHIICNKNVNKFNHEEKEMSTEKSK